MFLQCEFIKWLNTRGVLFCASCGGMRTSIRTAVNMKRAGYKKGYPDISIFHRNKDYAGLMIEIKAGANRATPEQLAWQQELLKNGYCSLIMPSNLDFSQALDWLKNAVEDYLKSEDMTGRY